MNMHSQKSKKLYFPQACDLSLRHAVKRVRELKRIYDREKDALFPKTGEAEIIDLTSDEFDSKELKRARPSRPATFCLLTYIWTDKNWKNNQKSYKFDKFLSESEIKKENDSEDDFQPKIRRKTPTKKKKNTTKKQKK